MHKLTDLPVMVSLDDPIQNGDIDQIDRLLDTLYMLGFMTLDLRTPDAKTLIEEFLNERSTTPQALLLTDESTFDGDDGPTLRMCFYDDANGKYSSLLSEQPDTLKLENAYDIYDKLLG